MSAVETPGSLEGVILRLFDVQALKFGESTLKSGIVSPVYFDLRVIVSYPDLMREVSELIWKTLESAGCECASVCGVPYTALPLATCISVDHKVPMLIRRKEAKDYGTKKMVEGHFKAGDVCLVVEDVVTSGSSVLETVATLTGEGLVVKDAIVLLDRQQGGKQRLLSQGINLHSVIEIRFLVDVLLREKKITSEMRDKVIAFIEQNQFRPKPVNGNANTLLQVLPYAERADKCSHPLAKRLFSIMAKKKTNLAFSADVTSCDQLLKLADQVGPHICMLKTHADILEDFTLEFTKKLTGLAAMHDFLIFEDRKFADIGNTVKHQYSGGVHRIADWADLVNAHMVPGPGVIQGLKEVGLPLGRGGILIAEMSSEGNLCHEKYTKETVRQAEGCADFVMGFICRNRLSNNPSLVHMTPGVQLQEGKDQMGQCYLTPSEVIGHRRSDVIIVGRGILKAADPQVAAQQYQEAGYAAFEELLQA